ncbi:MAG TPA: calcium-binding protein [Sphingomicrobium sp.]|nr:calcium-binding protein [Sphingomicrobium sp.]
MPNFTGTSGNDIWTGGSDGEIATGGGGNDGLSGNGGNDQIVGDAGGDILNGGDGDDVLISGSAPVPALLGDYYYLSQVIPSIDTGLEIDTLNGGNGDDRIWAGYGDNVNGGAQSSFGDYLSITFIAAPNGINFDGSLGTWTIGGGTIQGIENIDWIQGSNFNDVISGATLTATPYSHFGEIYGMGGNDTLTAGYYTWAMDGGDGDDIVDGRNSGYIHSVIGGAGNDTLYTPTNGNASSDGGAGNDTFYGAGPMFGGAGNDTFYIQLGSFGGVAFGDAGDDTLNGNEYGDLMSGGSGADHLEGGGGDDRLQSGTGNSQNYYEMVPDTGTEHDVVNGGAGNDIIAIGYGDDADGGAGTDRLILSLAGAPGGVTMDLTELGDGSAVIGGGTISNFEVVEQINATEFADQLILGTFEELIIVNALGGNDLIQTGGSSAQVDAGAGDDHIVSGIAADVLDGGAGRDVVDYQAYASGVTVDLQSGTGGGGDILAHIEDVLGTAYGDTITGDAVANVLTGNGGDDALNGGAGADTLIGGLGNDSFYVDDAADLVVEAVGEGDDTAYVLGTYTLAQGASVETLVAFNQSSTDPLVLTGNEYGQSLYGNLGNNYLNGGQGDDFLVGLAGNDNLLGGTGADHMEGGVGDDVYYVDQAGDVITELAGEGNDILVATASYTLADGASIETMSSEQTNAAINLTGNELAQSLYGNAGNNILTGGGGADYMVGGAGNDKYYVDVSDFIGESVGGGDDWIFVATSYTLREGNEIETLVAVNQDSSDPVNFTGNEFGQSLYGSQGANQLDGGAGNDYLVGLGGNDFLIGGAGNDNLQGGTGNDLYYVDSGDQIFENAGEGDDLAVASQSFVLGAGQSLETLTAAEGSAAINLTGNALGQSIYGNAGANVLTSGGGADYMVGGAGSDTFFLTNAPGVATIGDYAAGEVVNITQYLSVANGTNVTTGGFVRITAAGELQVDANGGGDAYVTIANVPGSTAVTLRYLAGGVATNVNVSRSASQDAVVSKMAIDDGPTHAPALDGWHAGSALHDTPGLDPIAPHFEMHGII